MPFLISSVEVLVGKKIKGLVHYLNNRRKITKRDQLCDGNKSNKKPRHESIAQDVLGGVMKTSV